MSDWDFLDRHRMVQPIPRVPERYLSSPADGFNGLFRFVVDGEFLQCLASDGLGWQHVSVTILGSLKPPRWSTMCKIKDLFWEDEDWVVQFHPAKSQYVDCHPGCLHLWHPLNQPMPTPDSLLVGPRRRIVV